jgi:8-oxo-dGTP pyrophosphatase MutT (NUDIX family)
MKQPLREALSRYSPEAIGDSTAAGAAVLLLLYEREARPHIVFQKRSELVLHHKGQVSFPGGAADPRDHDAVHTALRETHEEIGVDPGHVEVLGRLDDIVTISNFRVTPVVGWLDRYPYAWRVREAEVAYLIEAAVDDLRNPANFVEDRRVVGDREVVLPSYRVGDDLIWGATARMLTNFLDIWASLDVSMSARR